MLRISNTIRRRETADGGILLDIHHGQMFSLNLLGTKILELIHCGHDESSIIEEISDHYGADKDAVRADVSNFISILEDHHILSREPSITAPPVSTEKERR